MTWEILFSQCGIAASKGNLVLKVEWEKHKTQEQKLIISLYKAIVRPYLENCIQVWGLYRKKDVDTHAEESN